MLVSVCLLLPVSLSVSIGAACYSATMSFGPPFERCRASAYASQRVSVCLRLEWTRRAFASQRVCASACDSGRFVDLLLRNVRMSAWLRLESTALGEPAIGISESKIDLRSVQNRPWEGLKSTSGASKIDPGRV